MHVSEIERQMLGIKRIRKIHILLTLYILRNKIKLSSAFILSLRQDMRSTFYRAVSAGGVLGSCIVHQSPAGRGYRLKRDTKIKWTF